MAHDLNAYRLKLDGGAKRIPASKIAAWIEKHFDFKTRKDGDEYCICNPFNGDTGFHMNINPEKMVVHCWTGDEWAGPVNPNTGKRNCSFIQLVKLYKKCSYQEAVKDVLDTTEDIRAFLRPEARHSTAKPTRKIAVALPEGTERLTYDIDKQKRILINWLISRGYTIQDIDKNDIYSLGIDVYWPYYEFDELVYWQSRSRFNKIYRFPDTTIYDRKGAIVGETEGSKGDFLYGFDECDSANYLILTESIFGQYTLGQQALASGGALITPSQIGKIKILGPRKGIILSPDNDKAGIQSIISNKTLLKSVGYPIFYSVPPRIEYVEDGKRHYTKDWNEFITKLKISKEEIREIHDRGIKRLTHASLSHLYSFMPRHKN